MAIQVLHLEDDPLDAALVHEELRRDGLECDIAHVPTRIAFESALARKPDIVLADYALPDFNGLEAQRLLRPGPSVFHMRP